LNSPAAWNVTWDDEPAFSVASALKCKKGQIAAASPVTYVDAKSPPMLLIVGSEDKTVPYHQTLEMAGKLKAAGAAPELMVIRMVIRGVDQMLIGKTLKETRNANLKTLDATFRFIDKTMENDASVWERPQP
jgi:acetyl esterase/lipase